MSHTLHVRLRKVEGSLVRLLGQVGRRGYDVLGVTAKLSADRAAFDVVVDFEPFIPPAPHASRPAEVLVALVAKLCDVEKVEMRSTSVKPPENRSSQPAPARKPAGETRWEE